MTERTWRLIVDTSRMEPAAPPVSASTTASRPLKGPIWALAGAYQAASSASRSASVAASLLARASTNRLISARVASVSMRQSWPTAPPDAGPDVSRRDRGQQTSSADDALDDPAGVGDELVDHRLELGQLAFVDGDVDHVQLLVVAVGDERGRRPALGPQLHRKSVPAGRDHLHLEH